MGQEDVFAPCDAFRNAEILRVDGDSQRRLLLSQGAARVQLAESGNEASTVALDTAAQPRHCGESRASSRRHEIDMLPT
jgi:hypothetical protein